MVNAEIEYSVIELTRDRSILVVATECLPEMEDILGESNVLATVLGTLGTRPLICDAWS